MALHLGSRDALLSVFVFCRACAAMAACQPEGCVGGMERDVANDRCRLLPWATTDRCNVFSSEASFCMISFKIFFFCSFNSKHICRNGHLLYINVLSNFLACFSTHWFVTSVFPLQWVYLLLFLMNLEENRDDCFLWTTDSVICFFSMHYVSLMQLLCVFFF